MLVAFPRVLFQTLCQVSFFFTDKPFCPRHSLVLEIIFLAGWRFFTQIDTNKWKVFNCMCKTEKNIKVALFLKAKSKVIILSSSWTQGEAQDVHSLWRCFPRNAIYSNIWARGNVWMSLRHQPNPISRHKDGVLLGTCFVLVYVTSCWEWLKEFISSLLKESALHKALFVEMGF